MDLKTKKTGNIIEVFLIGRLDVQLSSDIEKELHRIIKSDTQSHLLLNLDGITYLSSSGIRIFISTMRALKENNRKLKICNMDNEAKKIFEVVELMDMFEIFETAEAAIISFNELID